MHSIAEIYRSHFGDGCLHPLSNEFCARFGADSALYGCDFRRHYNGWGYNAIRVSHPAPTRSLHLDRAWSHTQEMAAWLLDRRSHFGPEDQLQLIVTWPDPIRRKDKHIIRAGSSFDDLSRLAAADSIASYEAQCGWHSLCHGWDYGLGDAPPA